MNLIKTVQLNKRKKFWDKIVLIAGGLSVHTIGLAAMTTAPVLIKTGKAEPLARYADTTSKMKAEMLSIPVLDTSFNRIDTKMKLAAERLREKTEGLDKYLAENGFNTEFCILIDMSIPSGKNRFFVYDVRKDEVKLSSLVSHGSGSYSKGCDDKLVFSNKPSRNATSIGKYRIGASYYGNFGPAFKLFGLDTTNSNAYPRAIVLHSDRYVPEKETYPRHIFESAGCPVLSPAILTIVSKYIKTSKKPVLLWIYN